MSARYDFLRLPYLKISMKIKSRRVSNVTRGKKYLVFGKSELRRLFPFNTYQTMLGSYRNQSVYFHSIDWFLYQGNIDLIWFKEHIGG